LELAREWAPDPETQKLLSFIIRRYQKPLVLDADA
jgi:NAD(P)H-hydrate repair Nnr-like enzyme with NAD(P)H-hydrate dehydratase domain